MPDLVVEVWLTAAGQWTRDRYPGCRPAVHDGTLTVLDTDGEQAGYAPGVWRRWWWEPAQG